MDFIKLSEEIYDEPKMLAVGCEGFTLYVKGLAYSKKHLLDGFVPSYALPLIGIGLKKIEATIKDLVKQDLWEPTEGGYRVSAERWARWQMTKAEVEEQRRYWKDKKEKQRQKLLGNPPGVHPLSPGDTQGESQVNLQRIPPQEKEKEKEKETASSSADAHAAAPFGIFLSPAWDFPGHWKTDEGVRSEILKIEGRRSPTVPQINRDEVMLLADGIQANGITAEDLIKVLRSEKTKGWKKVPNDGVIRIWREMKSAAQATGNSGGNSGSTLTEEERRRLDAEDSELVGR